MTDEKEFKDCVPCQAFSSRKSFWEHAENNEKRHLFASFVHHQHYSAETLRPELRHKRTKVNSQKYEKKYDVSMNREFQHQYIVKSAGK